MVVTSRNSLESDVGCGDGALAEAVITKAYQGGVRLEDTRVVSPRATGNFVGAIVEIACNHPEHQELKMQGLTIEATDNTRDYVPFVFYGITFENKLDLIKIDYLFNFGGL